MGMTYVGSQRGYGFSKIANVKQATILRLIVKDANIQGFMPWKQYMNRVSILPFDCSQHLSRSLEAKPLEIELELVRFTTVLFPLISS